MGKIEKEKLEIRNKFQFTKRRNFKIRRLEEYFGQDYRVDKRGGLKDNQLQKRQPRINADGHGF
jgi:hypothetical protein